MSPFTIEFHQIALEAFASLPEALRSEAFFRANEHTNAYVDQAAREVLEQFPQGAGVRRDRLPLWRWLERKALLAGASVAGRGALRAAILAENPALAPALDAVDAAADGYPAFLRGEREGSSILFDAARPELWERYFNNHNPVYGAVNLLAATAAERAVAIFPATKRLQALEVGAGLGSGAEALLERLAPRFERYIASDISPGFLRRARERLDALGLRQTSIELRLLDLNANPEKWRLERRSLDLVHAVNVLHTVRDLQTTLRGLRELLVPGGLLILGECVRPQRGHPVHPEFIFLLLDELRTVQLDPRLRPEWGFLDAASWRASLADAGFTAIELLPDFERAVAAYPEHSLAAIVARAP